VLWPGAFSQFGVRRRTLRYVEYLELRKHAWGQCIVGRSRTAGEICGRGFPATVHRIRNRSPLPRDSPRGSPRLCGHWPCAPPFQETENPLSRCCPTSSPPMILVQNWTQTREPSDHERPFRKTEEPTPAPHRRRAGYRTNIPARSSSALALPASCSASSRANSRAVPGPRLVVTLRSTTTRSSTATVVGPKCLSNDG